MFSFLAQGVIGEILAPVKSPGQQLHGAIEDNLNDKVSQRSEYGDWNGGIDGFVYAAGDAILRLPGLAEQLIRKFFCLVTWLIPGDAPD